MSSRLSVVMIVKDEAQMAEGFLDVTRPLWDELVVVDTGSVDGTAALFENAGAHLVHQPWTDDFSAARNAALALATGDWVLVLDADERVSPEFIAEFRPLLDDPSIGACTVRISNALPYGHQRESRVLRAWRHHPSIQFQFPVHEDPTASVAARLALTSTTLAHVEAPVEHLGYVRSRAAVKDKKSRDLKLLRHCITTNPFDFYSRLKVLELARFWHDGVLWHQAARETADALDQAGRQSLGQAPWAGELVALTAEGLFKPASSAGLVWLDDWLPRVVPSPPLFHRRALMHEHQGHLPEARADYERCLTLGDALGDVQLLVVRPRLGLARLAIAEGDTQQAVEHAAIALEHAPRDPEALVAVVTLRRALEGPRALDEWESEHRTRFPACPERDWAIGEALYTLGDFKGAIARLRLAAGVPPAGPAGVRLGHALLADSQLEAAELVCRQLLLTEPEAGLGVLVFDLMKGRSSHLELDLTPETANAAMRHWIDALLASKNVTWRQQLSLHADAVSSLFPWLGDYLARRTG